MPDNGKVSKRSVNYRPAEGDDVDRKSGKFRRCGTCSMFRSPNRCTLVRGLIHSDDVCDRWEAKR
jgi:hypothetical protein